ncbi:MAG: LytTR family DNA-binding domain-containing protein, partial [Bacilli bacterium]
MIRIAIVEDNESDLKNITNHLLNYQKLESYSMQIETFHTAKDFFSIWNSNFDLIFLDIELPDSNGMQIAKQIRQIDDDVFIIFCTNIASLALEGYTYHPLDYFLKPLQYNDLKLRMDKVRNSVIRKGFNFAVSQQGGLRIIFSNQLVYVESFGHTLVYHMIDGEKITSRGKSMKEIDTILLDKGFARPNVSFLVNLRFFKAIIDYDVLLTNGEKISTNR